MSGRFTELSHTLNSVGLERDSSFRRKFILPRKLLAPQPWPTQHTIQVSFNTQGGPETSGTCNLCNNSLKRWQ